MANPLLESDIISYLKACFGRTSIPGVTIGLETPDDCALLSSGWLLSKDLLVEGQHFRWDWIKPQELGWKAIAVNVSDIAAKGGTPFGVLLGLQIPRHVPRRQFTGLIQGLKSACDYYGCPVFGGDTVGSPTGTWTLSVTVLGRGQKRTFRPRSGARSGDTLLVTSPLGSSHVLWQWLERFGRRGLKDFSPHFVPKAELQEGQFLARRQEVHAMMDLSDGLATDLPRMLEASGVSASVQLKDLPVSGLVRKLAPQLGIRVPEEIAWIGGEDYALLLSVETKGLESLQRAFFKAFKRRLLPVGRVQRESKLPSIRLHGFRHFK